VAFGSSVISYRVIYIHVIIDLGICRHLYMARYTIEELHNML